MRRIIMIGAAVALVVTAAVIELEHEPIEGSGDTREHGEKGTPREPWMAMIELMDGRPLIQAA